MKRYITVKERPEQVQRQTAERSIRNVGEDILNEKITRLQAYVQLLELKLRSARTPQEKERLNQLISKACETLKEVISVPV